MIYVSNLIRTVTKKDWHPDYTVFIVRLSKIVKIKIASPV